jgi:hypothetical protein
MWKRGATYSSLATSVTPTRTCSIIADSAAIVTIQIQRPRHERTFHAMSAMIPASAFAVIAT